MPGTVVRTAHLALNAAASGVSCAGRRGPKIRAGGKESFRLPPALLPHVTGILLSFLIQSVNFLFGGRGETGLEGEKAVWAVIEVHEQSRSGMVVFSTSITGGMSGIEPFNSLVAMRSGCMRS